MKGMTPKQKQIHDFIGKFCRKNGYSPTYREIQAGLGLANSNSVAAHVAALRKKGFITIEPGKARTLRQATEA